MTMITSAPVAPCSGLVRQISGMTPETHQQSDGNREHEQVGIHIFNCD
jgi:hypothetical protein